MNPGQQEDADRLEQVLHVALGFGRLLLQNGGETEQVEEAVTRFTAALGYKTNLLVTYEALLLTAADGSQFRTKVGQRIPAMNVNMTVVTALNRLVRQVELGRQELREVREELERIERTPPACNRWVIVFGLGLTAASLSRLFGGDWPAFAIAWAAGAAGTCLRQELAGRKLNVFFIAFAGALASGVIGGSLAALGWTATPVLCLVAPGMIIVPGVPLVNGIQDIIKNHMMLGLGRLGFGTVITLAIALGLALSTVLTGAHLPMAATGRSLSILENAFFSAIAAMGYVCLFNVHRSMAWACVLCGMVSFTLRSLGVHHGVPLAAGTLVGAGAVGLLAHFFARYYQAPPATFAFPGVVAMVPGAFAFRVVMGCLRIGGDAASSPALVTETTILAVDCILMLGAIAVGIAAPLSLFARRERQ